MNPCELTFAITALANAIASNFNDDELGVLAAATAQLGDTLATILAQRVLCESLKNKNQATISSGESGSSNSASAADASSNFDSSDSSNSSGK